ncbi:hypothetical protein HZB90_01735 [archaeon]|nr:hypothetical protein [archaeon]
MRDPQTYTMENPYMKRGDENRGAKDASKERRAYRNDDESVFLPLKLPEDDDMAVWRRGVQPQIRDESPLEKGFGMPYGLGGTGMPSMGYNPFAGQKPATGDGYRNASTLNIQYTAADGTMYRMSVTAPQANRMQAAGNMLMGLYALMAAEGGGYEGGKGGSYAGGKGGGSYSGGGSK